ncbi:hypothetical protein N8I77_000036 [Diaporthe amygdali]|uniref:Uncharacterized protein n=1 Tax=Phomopsis amygdali TaxID=1214568 RepID=A0AAD9SNS6_PHOAM|nr:hypothetical protein N8I77_000036 [Diaporthe amygdali]
MASAGVQESPPMAPAPPLVVGDATAQDGLDKEDSNKSNGRDDTNNIDNTIASHSKSPVPVSNTASASATASPSPTAPDSPIRIVSDIQDVSHHPPPPHPVAAASATVYLPPMASAPAPPTSVPSPASSASPSIHGLGARLAVSSRGNTPLRSPALPSPSVPLRASPAASHLPPAATQLTPATRVNSYQNSPTWRAQSPRPHRKVPITPAPGPGTGSPAPPPTAGFPSPGRDHVHADPKFLDDKTRITYGIQQAIPEAVRRSVRDNWEKCLLGSDFHQAFILNASIHHATPAAVQRGMRDFGKAMISAAKNEIVDAMTPADIDAVAAHLLTKASDAFLDAALELRLKSINAKRLINALARAERLGYEPGDVQAEDNDTTASQPPVHQEPVMAPQSTAQMPAHPGQPTAQALYCGMCFRKFNHQSAYEHHVKAKVCTRSPSAPGGFKFSCQHCGQGFTTIMGVQYHNANKVCGDFKEPYSPNTAPVASTPTAPRAKRSAPTTPAPLPTPALTSASISTSTPASSRAGARPSSSGDGSRKGTPGLHTSDGAVADPYAHLSPEQLAAMQEELRQAELTYGERFRQACTIPDPAEKKTRLDGLANSFGTKQSLIRKKYGVRLRMRRTKAEIQAERDRMQYKTAAELAADIGIQSAGPGRPGRPITSTPRPASTIARGSNGGTGTMWSSVNRPGVQAPTSTLASASPVPSPALGDSRAADVSMHGGNKRRFSGSGPSPSSKRLAYSEMGGLSGGAAADAETMDPTLPPGSGTRAASTAGAKGQGTAEEPMALDDTESESEDSGDDDEDIPAELPPSVRQSLQQGSPSVTPGL